MKRLIAPVALVAVLTLTGCGASGPDAAPATQTASVDAPATPRPQTTDLIDQPVLEAALVEEVRAQLGDAVAEESDEAIVSLAWSVCRALESDVQPGEVVEQFTSNGYDKDVAVNMIMGAAVLLCSDQAPKVANGW